MATYTVEPAPWHELYPSPDDRLAQRLDTLEAHVQNLQGRVSRDLTHADLRATRAQRKINDLEREVLTWKWTVGLALVGGLAGVALARLAGG